MFEKVFARRGKEEKGGATLMGHDCDIERHVEQPATTDVTPKRRVTIASLSRRQKLAIVWCFFFYAVGIYTVVFHLMESSSHIIETASSALTKTYGSITNSITQSFESLTNPQTSEEIVGLMTEFYELLAKMGYYDAAIIQRPIHNPGVNVSQALELGYSPKAIQFMQMLPYVKSYDSEGEYELQWGGSDNEFMLSGRFADLREEGALSECRDPLYVLSNDKEMLGWDESGGKYMKPDYVCLMFLGNHGAFMVLNVQNYQLWTIDSESGNADPMLQAPEEEVSSNENSLDNYPSRPARHALRYYMQKFANLEWIPGGLHNGTYDGENYRRMYLRNGWPDNFNSSGLAADRVQWEAEQDVRRISEQPFEDLRRLEWHIKSNAEAEVRYLQQILDVDAGKELPNKQVLKSDGSEDRAKYRQEIVDLLQQLREEKPHLEAELAAARDLVKSVDPGVAKAREERIAAYGEYGWW